ncbi:MAG: RNA 2',3'-cyclic phosphodiesterase [Chloroflexota bacterium]
MEEIRSFIAIELPDELKAALTRLQAQLKASDPPSVKWVDAYGIHLTLKFLGNVTFKQIEEITRAMAKAAAGISPFRLEVKDLGVFPGPTRVRVVWVGLGGEIDRLTQLQEKIEADVAPLGFLPEGRPFTPHLTLARVREQATPQERESLGQLITNTKATIDYAFTVDSVNLIRSILSREGALYSRLATVPLKPFGQSKMRI